MWIIAREKLSKLLSAKNGTSQHKLKKVQQKIPALSLIGLTEETTKEEIMHKVMNQNPGIDTMVQQGEELKFVYLENPT